MPRPWRARSRARDTGLRTHSRPRTPRPRAPGARSRGVSSRRAALGAPRRRAATTKGRRGRGVGTPGSLSRSNDNGCGVSSAQHCRAATAIISHADGSARLLLRSHCDPMTAAPAPPLILIAANPEHSLASVFEGRNYIVVQVHTGTLAGEWVRDVRPDTIIIDAELPDMSGIDACGLLHSDLRIGDTVPTLILAPNKPTPDERVAALRAGVWDFLLYPPYPEELLLTLDTYVQATRHIDVALAGLVDPATGLHTRPALARRARELAALMSRARGGLACVVFALDADPAEPKAGSIVVRSARVSDVVGALSPTEFAVLAPGTDQAGAVKLAKRIGGAMRHAVGAGSSDASGAALQVGYDAVPNLKYSPIDPVALLLRATTAVRTGTPEPGCSWMRRFDESKASAREAGAAPRTTPSGLVRGNRGTGV